MYIVSQDQGKREYMEDTVYVKENISNGISIYCVFDGHGGDFVSEFLKENIAKTTIDLLAKDIKYIPQLLYLIFTKLSEKLPRDQSMHTGSTALVAIRYADKVFVANSGDCRAVINSYNTVNQVTEDHKPAVPGEMQRIHQTGGFVTITPDDVPRVNGMLAVSRSFGDLYLHPAVTWKPDIYVIDADSSNNFLIMASDGLWDTMSNEDVMKVVLSAVVANKGLVTRDLMERAGQKCISLAQAKGSMDNISIIIKLL
jgi:protein phosphatase 1L